MNEINTVMEPFIWNYTQIKGTNFSRLLVIDAELPDAIYDFKIVGAKGTFLPVIKVVSIANGKTVLNVSLIAEQTNMMSPQNKWYFKVIYKSEVFVCWIGTFNLRPII